MFSAAALRRAVLFVHLWLGLLVGLYFSVIGLTGSILVFESDIESRQIIRERRFVAPPQEGAALLPLSQVIAHLRTQFPKASDSELAFTNPPLQPDGAYLFRLNTGDRKEIVTVSPYTGEVIRRYARDATWLSWVEDLHVRLLFKEPGKLANGYGGLLAGLLVLSGLWLWWPRTVRQLRIRLSVKRGAGAHRIISDLHNVMGIYPFVLLLIVTLTGSVIVFYKPVQAVVVALVGTSKTPRIPRFTAPINAKRLPVEQLMGIAERTSPNADYVFVVYPTKKNQPFYAYRRAHTGILPDIRIYINPYTGKLLQVGSDSTDPTDRRIMRSASTIHFGYWGGGFVKALYFLVGLMPLGLFVTGVLMYLRKRRAKYANKRRKRGEVIPAQAPSSAANTST